MTTIASEMKNQWRRNTSFDEIEKARAESSARMAYSVKCAALRIRKCARASLSSEMPGNNQSSSGRMMRDVFSAENSPVEAKKMKASQRMSGPYRPIRDHSCPPCLVTTF